MDYFLVFFFLTGLPTSVLYALIFEILLSIARKLFKNWRG